MDKEIFLKWLSEDEKFRSQVKNILNGIRGDSTNFFKSNSFDHVSTSEYCIVFRNLDKKDSFFAIEIGFRGYYFGHLTFLNDKEDEKCKTIDSYLKLNCIYSSLRSRGLERFLSVYDDRVSHLIKLLREADIFTVRANNALDEFLVQKTKPLLCRD